MKHEPNMLSMMFSLKIHQIAKKRGKNSQNKNSLPNTYNQSNLQVYTVNFYGIYNIRGTV